MSAYKIKILKPNNWRAHRVGRLDISVGAPNHEGERLETTLAWSASKFAHVIISVADTLQRHNMMADGCGEEDARRISYAEGTAWIERNSGSFQILPSFSIKRWDERLTHPLYGQYLEKTQQYYERDDDIRIATRREAAHYLSRRGSSASMSQHRIDYLVEELAVFDMLFNIEPAADVYPGSMLPFWDMPPWSDRAKFTRIDFVRRSA